MLKVNKILILLVLGLLFTACGSDRAGNNAHSQGVLGVSDSSGDNNTTVDNNTTDSNDENITTMVDSDKDGISDTDELNLYGTNPDSNDTDGDGLSDSEEIYTYESNASSPDSDGDGLQDGEEITIYDTNLTNPDTDGDGLNDGDEINTYGSDAKNSDTDADGLLDGEEILVYSTDVTNIDTDGDGLSDGAEVTQYETNATSVDTDGDGLNDRDEIYTYDSNVTNPDTDYDGLKDGDEVNTHDTNLTNPDSDGDCLLDGFEVLHYLTNPNDSDSDNDTVPDGIEIYSYSANDLNVSCLTMPETLQIGHNENPAKDAIPTAETDSINALDPTNDNDGDGQSNVFENNCTDGDALDANKLCPSILENELGQLLTKNGYSYIPGGFDVDGDGINEGGFWISRYQARVSGVQIPSETIIADVGNVNKYVSEKFKVLNRNIDVLSYNEAPLQETGVVAGSHLIFDEESIAGVDRVSTFTPYLAQVCLSRYKLKDEDGNEIDINITMPTQKQYVHVKMLLDADLVTPNENGLLGDGRHVRNGVLGTDPNVPLHNYKLVIDEFGEELKEYVRNLVQLRRTIDTDTFVDTFTFNEDVPDWWNVDINKFKSFDKGANATQDLGYGIGPEKDAYAVIVRGGESLDVTQGVSGALTDDPGQTNGISFRAATDYLY
jgi:hypothetical protein